MQQNELMLKRIEKDVTYFDDIYTNRGQYKSEWAFEDAQSRLDNLVKKFKCSGCCSKDAKKRVDKKMKNSLMISRIFKNLHLGITVLETLISVVFVLFVSEISHSVDLMVESHTLSLYFLGAFALIKVLFENNIIRPVFQSISWRLYKYSYQTLHSTVLSSMSNLEEESAEPVEALELRFG